VERLGGSVYHRHEWLSMLESVSLVSVEPLHIVVRRGGRVTAIAPFYRTERCPKFEMFLSQYVSTRGMDDCRFFVGHSMYAQSSQILAEDAVDRQVVLEQVETLRRGQRSHAGVVVFPLVPEDDPLLLLLKEDGYRIGLLSCTNLLDIRWDTFEGYLASLRSAKRLNILKGMRISEEGGLKAKWGIEPSTTGIITELIRRTAEHHGSPVFFDSQFIAGIFEHLSGLIDVCTLAVGNEALLSCLVLTDGTELLPWCIGFDYDKLGKYGHYNYLYVELIKYAIQRGYRRINLGRSTYYIKRKYGFRQRPVYIAARFDDSLAEPVSGWIEAIEAFARDELEINGLISVLDR
jgi:predicted N-acyltransferase